MIKEREREREREREKLLWEVKKAITFDNEYNFWKAQKMIDSMW
jgi:hypothetical protein